MENNIGIQSQMAEAAQCQSEEEYRFMFAHHPQPMWIYDLETLAFLEVNNAAINHYGYSREEFLSMTIKDIRPIEDIPALLKDVDATSQTYNLAGEWRHLKKNGEIIVVEITSQTIVFNDRESRHVLVNDITDRKHTEKVLRESQQQLLNIIDFLPDATFVVDNDKKVIAWNKAMEEMTGVLKQDMIGKGDHAYAIPFYGQKQNLFIDLLDFTEEERNARYSNVIWKGSSQHAEIFAPALNRGNGAYISVMGAPLFNSNGERMGSIESIRDISDHKKMEETIQNERLQLRTIIDNLPDAIYSKDLACRKTLSNLTNLNYMGAKTEAEVLGRTDFDFYPKEIAEKFFTDDQSVMKTGKPVINREEYVYDNIGQKIWLLTSKLPLRDKNERIIGLIGISRNITDRKRIEEVLLESEEFLKETQKIAELGNWAFDIVSGTWKSSELLDTILGIETGFDKSIEGFTKIIHPEWREIMLDYLMIEVIGKKAKFDKEFKIIRQTDGAERWVQGNGKLKYDGNNKPLKMIGTILDVTDRKQAEVNLIEAKYKAQESDRLKSAFLANMSHEIRTPMNGILGFIDLLKGSDFTGEQQQEFIHIIHQSGQKMLNLLNEIIEISKIESGEMGISISETNINENIQYIYNFFKPEVEKKGLQFSISNALPAEAAIVRTDSMKVHSILMNLVNNAIKFTNKGFIECGCKKKDKLLEFFVKDTGQGIDPEQKELIFERFRQGSEGLTKISEGAGLGLSISKAFVKMLGGTIWLESEIGKGSTFYFTIACNA